MASIKIIFEPAQQTKGNVTERINTLDDVYAEVGMKPGDTIEVNVPAAIADMLPYFQNEIQKMLVCRALNEGWTADKKDPEQRKYYPWHRFNAGSGFAFGGSGGGDVDSLVGSRLQLKNSQLSDHAGKQFIELWTEQNIK